ncbi:MAG: ABC transporter substrate-binding protein [Gammaproteobacteria bacterium]
MKRIPTTLILSIALCGFLAPANIAAQRTKTIYRIGLLTPYTLSSPSQAERIGIFEQTLRDRGYIKGENISFIYRSTEGQNALTSDLVAELLRLKVDVLVTHGTLETRAAQEARSTVPIVMATVADPVGSGFIASLSHPGGNITGSSELSEELVPKRLELLKEVLPRASRIAVLWDPTHPANRLDLKRAEAAAQALNMRVRAIAAHELAEYEKAFAEMERGRPDGLVVLVSYSAFTHVARIVDLARNAKLPMMYGARPAAEAGALMSYGPDPIDQYRHAATFVDKILRGAKPADLPVEQPTRFELVINLKTAKALGLMIPQSILVRADVVIK